MSTATTQPHATLDDHLWEIVQKRGSLTGASPTEAAMILLSRELAGDSMLNQQFTSQEAKLAHLKELIRLWSLERKLSHSRPGSYTVRKHTEK